MTLDDIEKQARAIEGRRTGSLTFEVTTDLARAVLAMLPTIREAHQLIEYLDLVEKQTGAHNAGVVGADLAGEPLSYIQPSARSSLRRETRALRAAISTMRATLSGEKRGG